ncbi:MAG: ribonuclease P protein component [Rubrivivax sp.]|nr:ribonuclease P protein component [Rubrivivax sp.]
MHKPDFERLLATPSRSRSAHFAVHHVMGRPSAPRRAGVTAEPGKLSTGPSDNSPEPVDNEFSLLWVGAVVPKRHARRAVTRSLLKRQIRGAFERHAAALPGGLWLVRLRAPFAPRDYPSAASAALAGAARVELDQLLERVRQRPAPPLPAVPLA